MAANFQKDLKSGQIMELQFLELYKDSLLLTEGKNGDLIVVHDRSIIELKSDRYDHSKTENLFMERYSYAEKDGGPWQALAKGVKWYVYWFPKSQHIYCFDTKSLVKLLEDIMDVKKLIPIRNIGYITRGWKVKKSDLKHIQVTMEDILNDNKKRK